MFRQNQPGRRPRKLSDQDVARIRELHDVGWSCRDLAGLMNVSPMSISRALQGHNPTLPLLRGVRGLDDAGAIEESKPGQPGQAPQPAAAEGQQ